MDPTIVDNTAPAGTGDSAPPDVDTGDTNQPVIPETPGDTGTPSEPQTPPTTPEPQGAEPTGVVKELIHTRKRAQEAERRAAYLEGQLVGRGPQPQAPVIAPPDTPSPEPDPAAFTDFNQYEKARNTWILNEATRRAVVELEKKTRTTTMQSKFESVQSKVVAAAQTDEDISSAIHDPTFNQSATVAELIADTDNPVPIVKYLAGNRDVLDRLNRLSPTQAAKEFGKIEATISMPPPEPPKKISSAPPPIKPITSTGAVGGMSEDDMSTDEWMAKERQRKGMRAT